MSAQPPHGELPPPTRLSSGDEVSAIGRAKSRILSGLFLALPLVLAIWLVGFSYNLLRSYVLDPVLRLLRDLLSDDQTVAALPEWWRIYVAPLLAMAIVLGLLYLLGVFIQSRFYGLTNRLLLRVPFVTPVYQAVLNVFEALESQRRSLRFKRVVLVAFPHPGMRSIGMVTNTLTDQRTGRPIVCVCVLTGVMPPTGFTLFVPEENVTDLDWPLQQAIQAIVSGGITAPTHIDYYAPSTPAHPPAVSDPDRNDPPR
jgi:uncharacterized membrane protein